jgi:UDP-N-acetylglucosamine acyltransferase
MIHPTALIHPNAQLGADVSVGPYAVVEGPAQIGDGCVIQAHAIISGRVVMGRENVIGYGAVIGGEPQDLSFKPETQSEVRIGDRNRIREYCTLHRGSKDGGATVVGNDCFLMAGAHLAHDVRLGDRVIIANNSLLGGHVSVSDGVFIGGGSVFHQHIRVGRLAITQGNSGFGKDIPPFTVGAEVNVIAGLNVIGLRRAGLNAEQRREVKEAFDLLYRSGRNTTQALEAAREREWGTEGREFWDFVAAAKKRGICALMRSASVADAET